MIITTDRESKMAYRKTTAILLSAAMLVAQGCSSQTDVQQSMAFQEDPAFAAWLRSLLQKVQADPEYKRLPLDTEAQSAEFEAKLHQLYRGQISKAAFSSWLNTTYPGHAYELGVILGALQK